MSEKPEMSLEEALVLAEKALDAYERLRSEGLKSWQMNLDEFVRSAALALPVLVREVRYLTSDEFWRDLEAPIIPPPVPTRRLKCRIVSRKTRSVPEITDDD